MTEFDLAESLLTREYRISSVTLQHNAAFVDSNKGKSHKNIGTQRVNVWDTMVQTLARLVHKIDCTLFIYIRTRKVWLQPRVDIM